jgi:uracil-DNA glycosylase
LPFIYEEIEAVSPKMIIALGNTTAQALLNNKKSMRSNRGVFHFCHGFPLCVTHDPLFLIHNDVLTVKRIVWEDMVSVMDFLKMPVSEKQRAFFT